VIMLWIVVSIIKITYRRKGYFPVKKKGKSSQAFISGTGFEIQGNHGCAQILGFQRVILEVVAGIFQGFIQHHSGVIVHTGSFGGEISLHGFEVIHEIRFLGGVLVRVVGIGHGRAFIGITHRFDGFGISITTAACFSDEHGVVVQFLECLAEHDRVIE